MSVTAPGGPSGRPDTPDQAVLRLSGDVDALTQVSYRQAADELLAGTSARTLVVDMSEVTTIDSSGLGLLVHLHTRSRDNDMGMTVVNIPARARALLKRTGLDRVFDADIDPGA